tara:strand:+ start:269 stop:484 length:216 start_codon:yes stop_codon:yes gene_type:complete
MEITRENKNARAQQVIIKTQKRLSSPSIQIQRTDNKINIRFLIHLQSEDNSESIELLNTCRQNGNFLQQSQ